MKYFLTTIFLLISCQLVFAWEFATKGVDPVGLHPHLSGGLAVVGDEIVFGSIGHESNRAMYVVHKDKNGKWHRYHVDSVDPACCDGHEIPSVWYNPHDQHYYMMYGSITAGRSATPECNNFRGPSPFFRKSINPNDPSKWGPREKLPLCGGLSEHMGFYTSDGVLHVMGQHQWTSIGGIHPRYEGFGFDYVRRLPNGKWEVSQLVDDGRDSGKGGPCNMDFKVYKDKLYVVWGDSTNGCAGTGRNYYSAISEDGGNTWWNWAKTKSFKRNKQTVGILGRNSNYEYDEAFAVYKGSTYYDAEISPSGILYKGGSKIRFARWNGTEWSHVDVGPTSAPNGLAMVQFGNNLVAHAAAAWGGDLLKYESKDGGKTWKTTTAVKRNNGITGSLRSPISTYSNGTVHTVVAHGKSPTGDIVYFSEKYSEPVVESEPQLNKIRLRIRIN